MSVPEGIQYLLAKSTGSLPWAGEITPQEEKVLDKYLSDSFKAYKESLQQENEARSRLEDAQKWHSYQELNQRINYRQAVEQARRNDSIDQTLEMRARPNPFVKPFQNGL